MDGHSSKPGQGHFEMTDEQIGLEVRQFSRAVVAKIVEEYATLPSEIQVYREHLLGQTGKMLRSSLVWGTANLTGGVTEVHVFAGAIVELIHLATLLHDDVLDGTQIRRGKPTIAISFGTKAAVLLGDCLFARAAEMTSRLGTMEVCSLVCGATERICVGELIQDQNIGNFGISELEYRRIASLKTGELFGLACELGAILNGVKSSVRRVLREFGVTFGTAYQMYDDCVDLLGKDFQVGKTLGADFTNGIPTLPYVLFSSRASKEDLDRFRQLRDTRTFDRLELLALLNRYRVFENAKAIIMNELERAWTILMEEFKGPTVLERFLEFLRKHVSDLLQCTTFA